ncbi:MAG: hypothetical protein BroJett040_04660 [Oligoflexia bacterium]|nr:MAG: hypothetical protein BroJett040_04660 [Oligoflexia bacterium]
MIRLFLSLLLFTPLVLAKSPKAPPHLDLELSSAEYTKLLEQSHLTFLEADPLKQIVQVGKRNLQWLEFMNAHRDSQHQLRLTTPGSLIGYPIEKPKKYSDQTITIEFSDLKKSLPAEMQKVIIDNKDFSQNPPVDEATYLEWARTTDKLYQTAVRWLLMKPYLEYLKEQKRLDVRGIYFLSQEPDLNKTLSQWSSLTNEKKAQYRDWLLQVCFNDKGLYQKCQSQLKEAEKNNRLFQFFETSRPGALQLWERFFKIPTLRSDVLWTSSMPNLMTVPFLDPGNPKLKNFLQTNIEDEWRTQSWNLKLDFRFTDDVDSIPHLEFEPGVTPHVNGLAGNTITMDANAPLEEWDVRWIIRHEYGHILGLPDCYTEFWEPSENLIVSYQLDTQNLMCSRMGKFLPLHFDELKGAYFK